MHRQTSTVKATPDGFNHRGGFIPRPSTYGRPSNMNSNRLTTFPGSSRPPSTTSSKVPTKSLIVKDQRDFGNKQYVASMVKDIAATLSLLNYSVNEENLLNPKSRKDFEAVFEILWSQILDQREFRLINAEESKKNEQIKYMLACLGYPFQLKDSTLKTITAPHSWKTMLGVLHWLISYIKAAFKFDYELLFENSVNDYTPFFPTAKLEETIFQTSALCFLSSEGGHEANICNIEEDFRNKLKSFNACSSVDIEKLEEIQNQRLTELQELKNTLMEGSSLPDEINRLELEKKKLEDYCRDLRKHHENELLPIISATQEKISRIGVELDEVNKEIVQNEEILSKQTISSAKALELKNSMEKVRSERMVLDEKIQKLQKNLDSSTVQLCNKSAAIVTQFEDFKTKAKQVIQKMGLDDSWNDFLSIDCAPTDPEFRRKCKEVLLPALDVAKEKSEEVIATKKAEIEKLRDAIEDIEEAISSAEKELADLDSNIENNKKKTSIMKDNNHPELNAKNREFETLKSSLDHLEKMSRMDLSQKKEELQRLKIKRDNLVENYDKQGEDMAECLQSMAEKVLEKRKKFEDVKNMHQKRVAIAIEKIGEEDALVQAQLKEILEKLEKED